MKNTFSKNFAPLSESLHTLCERFPRKERRVSAKPQLKIINTNYFPFFVISVFIFFAAVNLNAQNGNETLKKIQNKFKSINNFSADFTQSISDPEGKQGGKLSGKFFYKRKNKFIVELKSGSIISDGASVWNYDMRLKRVVISSFSDDPTSFSLERYIFDYPELCKINLIKNSKGGGDIIELVPKDNNIDFKNVKIWKNQDNMVSGLEIIDLADTKYVFQLSTIKTDQDMPDVKFNYVPTKGIKIIDLR